MTSEDERNGRLCDPIEVLATDFMERQRRGESPTVEEYAQRHPDLEDQILSLFPLITVVESSKAGDRHASDGRASLAGHRFEKLGDFQLIRELGRGGMGIVYEAEQLSLRRTVAVKVLPPQAVLAADNIRRFQHEAQTAARLHHPNIVPVFGVGECEGIHFLVMQRIDGEALDDYLREAAKSGKPAFQPRQVAAIGVQVARALAFAHQEQVLHRDIKPGNLLIGQDQQVWVADFGLARVVGDSVTTSTWLSGSLRYMAPERFQGQCDARSDVYSLGVTLLELLTERPAFPEREPAELMKRITEGAIDAALKGLAPSLPRDLRMIVCKAACADVRTRYSTAAELADDLQRYLDGQPVRARPIAAWESAWRWARRNPALAAAALTVWLSLLISTVALGIGYRSSYLANQRTREALSRESAALATSERTFELAFETLNQVVGELTPKVSSFHPSLWELSTEDGDPAIHQAMSAPSPQVARALEQVLPLYRRLATEAPHREQVAWRAAQAGGRLGRIRAQLGQYEPARQDFTQALSLLERLEPRQLKRVEVEILKAQLGNDLGEILSLRFQFRDAARTHRQVIQGLSSLAAPTTPRENPVSQGHGSGHSAGPNSFALEFERYRAMLNLGLLGVNRRLAGFRGNRPLAARARALFEPTPEQAEQLLTSAIDGLAELIRRFQDAESTAVVTPNSPVDRQDVALMSVRALRGRSQLPHRTWEDRDTDLSAAIAMLDELLQLRPDEPALLFEKSQALADFQLNSRPAPLVIRAAESRLRQSLEITNQLREQYPTVALYGVATAQTQLKMSLLLENTRRPERARAELREALDAADQLLERFPSQPAYLGLRLRITRALIRSYERAEMQSLASQLRQETEALLAALPKDLRRRPALQEVMRFFGSPAE